MIWNRRASHPSRRFVFFGTVATVCMLHACGPGEDHAVADVVADGDTSAPDRAAPLVDAKADRHREPTGPVEEGWEHWSDFDSDCNLRIPSGPEFMPPPFEWTVCPGTGGNEGLGCRWLAPREAGGRYALVTPPQLLTSPVVSVASQNAAGTESTTLVGEPDGSVFFAARSPVGCGVSQVVAHGDRLTLNLYKSSQPIRRGYATAERGTSRPRFVDSVLESDPIHFDFFPTSSGLLRLVSDVDLLDWQTLAPQSLVKSGGGDSNYQPGNFVDLGGGHILGEAGSRSRIRKFVYALGQEPIDLFGPTFVDGHGITDMATDGIDMAWAERASKPGDLEAELYATYAAPFSLDRAAIAATRRPLPFRADQSGSTGGGVLGCGRWARIIAQHFHDDQRDYVGLEVTRLADGKQWFYPSVVGAWQWGDPVGITCDELFITAYTPDPVLGVAPNVARIRFDSLPP